MKEKIDCNLLKSSLQNSHEQLPSIKLTHPTLELHEDEESIDIITSGIRTYICTHGECKLHYNRSHRRMSNYNWKKTQNNTSEVFNHITELALQIINKDNNILLETKKHKVNGDFCLHPQLTNAKHIHFIKGKDIEDNKQKRKQNPIETVFTKIDMIAEENNLRTKSVSKAPNAPGKPILESNNIRMTYGDINYLGSNKAILYFDRGRSGIQEFTNSMYPLKQQQKYKDLIVLDEIVFTSTCKCDSIKQHDRMFPHYRETCAVGLTCPAKLNKIERIIFTRNHNASTDMFTTARAMLIRYW
jgi:hypothetical protein